MNRKLLKILTFLLIFIALILSSTSSSATTNSDCKLNFSGNIFNPVFKNKTQLQSKVFYSSSDSDSGETNPVYTNDKTEIAEDIRNAMENHESSLTVYYCSELDFALEDADEDTLSTFYNSLILEDFLELSFEETNVATQGDYLRYSWHQCGYNTTSVKVDNIYNFDIILYFTYYTTKAQEDELTLAIDELIESFEFDTNTTDREKVDTIYTYITDNIKYDYEHLESTDYFLHFTAYAALMHETAVCEGYAVLFYRLTETCGVDSRVITGSSDNSRDEAHAWNIVKLDDYYYYVDATWDAESRIYSYYLKGSSDFIGHVNDSTFDSTEFTTTYPIPLTRTYNNK